MSNYPEIIKANQILQREQQQRGIVAPPATVTPVTRPAPATQTQSPKALPAPQPATRVIIHHHDHQQPENHLIRKAGHAAVLLVLGFLGV